jgi:hypothetical protein
MAIRRCRRTNQPPIYVEVGATEFGKGWRPDKCDPGSIEHFISMAASKFMESNRPRMVLQGVVRASSLSSSMPF